MTYLPDFLKLEKKDIPVTTKLNKTQYNLLKKYCDRYNLNMSFVIRRLVDDLLMHYKQ